LKKGGREDSKAEKSEVKWRYEPEILPGCFFASQNNELINALAETTINKKRKGIGFLQGA